MHRYIKRGMLVILAIIILAALYYREAIFYGLSQGYGQMRIIWNAQPVEKVLQGRELSDSIKQKIRLVQEIRKFAFDSLGLDPSDNYTTVYNQNGKPVLWVVTASDPYQLKAKEWEFPFLGGFSYKGFFKQEKAIAEEHELKKAGYDTDIGEVSGWSTLGWFKDPILTNMLRRSPGNLANLIIHELTHGTLYVKNNVQFNENLASFVGDKGALKFLEYKYGISSPEYKDYIETRNFNRKFSERVLLQANRLDSLYGVIKDHSLGEKQKQKSGFLKDIKQNLIEFAKRERPTLRQEFVAGIQNLNNTFFLDYRRYEEDLGQLEDVFRQKFNGNIKKYIIHLKKEYPSL